MKKRILFVDDEPLEIQQIQRAVSNMGTIWDVAYAASGPEALQQIESSPFDVVVSDMRMPGMDGLEFLNRVRADQPRTLRFILSSFADREMMMACVWGSHQFISKPFAASSLINTIQKALALDAWLSSETVKNLVAQMQNFPSLPAAYFEVLKRLESPNASVQDVGEAIAKDLAMTAKLLQMVNSAFFGLSQKVTNPSEAVSILGVETVKSILLCIQVFTHFDKISAKNLSLDQLWAHSLSVGNIAKRITMLETGDSKLADEAFTAGLLHDVGKLVFASNLPDQYNQTFELARQNTLPLWQAEEQTFQATHAEVGAYLLGLWAMPIPLVEATAFHHRPGIQEVDGFSLLTAVHVADALDYELRPDAQTLPSGGMDQDYLLKAGLHERIEDWRRAAAGEPVERPVRSSPTPSGAPDPDATVSSSDEAPSPELPWWKTSLIPIGATMVLALVICLLVYKTLRPPQVIVAGDEETNAVPALATSQSDQDANAAQASSEPASVVSENPPIVSADVTNEVVVSETVNAAKVQFPELKLQGIMFRQTGSTARINGKTYSRGDSVEGATITAISQSNVTLEFGGETRVLAMP